MGAALFAKYAEYDNQVNIDVRVAHQSIGNDEYEVSVRMTLHESRHTGIRKQAEYITASIDASAG